jgi:hypothetical protein
MKDSLQFLVVSDLHAHAGDPAHSNSPSLISSNSLYQSHNPIRSIPALLTKEGLAADWIVSPGDLGDRADPLAQEFAWNELVWLRDTISADLLIGTAGNHDLDSRRTFKDFDLKGALQLLHPKFPIELGCFTDGDDVFNDRYWSRNFVVVPFSDYDCTLVIVNSCAFHGYASEEAIAAEHTHGKLSSLTRDAILKAVAPSKTRLNILLVHHHPIRLPFVPDGNSAMVGGSELISVLKSTKRQWLIIHGHQHYPYLTYADADTFAPVVLSSGSVAARTFPVLGTHPRNQVHHVSIPLSKMDASGADLFGRIRSWSWIQAMGWQQAAADAGIPYHAGFGHRFDVKQVRDDVVSIAKSTELLDWSHVASQYPKLEYLVPEHLQSLLHMIEQAGVTIERDQYGQPRRLEYRA